MDVERLGSDFEAEAEVLAIKRALAFQIAQLMKEQKLSKSKLAQEMQTSRAAVDRLLDPANESVPRTPGRGVTLQTLVRAALALGKRLHVQFV